MFRRHLIQLFVGSILGLSSTTMPWTAFAQPAISFDTSKGERRLNLYRPETKETLNIVYLRDGKWVSNAYAEICWFLRDWQVGKAIQMDLKLIAILDWIGAYLRSYGINTPIHILSAYRSPETNRKLSKAASNSQHLYGKAVDFRIPGLSMQYLRELVRWLEQGGIGVYPHENENREFLHLDTGNIREWVG